MLGWSPIGTRPIGMIVDFPLPAITLAAVGQTLVYTLEVFSPLTGDRIIAAATREFATQPDDTLPNYPFAGRLNKALSFHRSVVEGKAFSGVSAGYGELELENSDGFYDEIESLAGARLLCRVGALGSRYDTFVTLLDGVVERSLPGQDSLVIEIRDRTGLLDIPVQSNIYAGTSGAEGGPSLAQKPKGLRFGSAKNITPEFEDTANLVYAIHDGQILAVTEARDQGVVIGLQSPGPTDFADYTTLVAGTVAPGKYITSLATGKIRLGAQPVELTCDIQGAVDSLGTYLRTTGQSVRWLLERAGFQVDVGFFINLDELSDASVDYCIASDSNATLHDTVDALLGGIDAFGGPRRDGVYSVGRIDVIDDDLISAVYKEIDIFDITMVQLPGNLEPRPWRIRMPFSVNWTIQAQTDDATVPATAAFVAAPYKLADPISDPDILAANSKAQDLQPTAYFTDATGASAETSRLFALLAETERRMFRMLVSTQAFDHDIGDTIQIFHSRFGLSGGLTVLVVGTRDEVSSAEETVELTVVG